MKEQISNNLTEARETDVVEHSALQEKRVMSKPIAARETEVFCQSSLKK